MRETGAGPSRLARHVRTLVGAAGGRWPAPTSVTDRPSIVEAPVRPLRDDHVAARLRSAVGRRTEHPCRSPWRSPLGRRRSPSSAATVPAAASGARLFLVAVADVDVAGFQMTLPADAASLDAVGEFCRTNPNAAVREFTVA